jgi:hypothetical protein
MRKPIIRSWTAEEISRFKTMVAEGASVARCSAAFNRSIVSIRSQARRLGVEIPGTRLVKAAQKAKIENAERNLPRGSQRFDGSRA